LGDGSGDATALFVGDVFGVTTALDMEFSDVDREQLSTKVKRKNVNIICFIWTLLTETLTLPAFLRIRCHEAVDRALRLSSSGRQRQLGR
jgi:hypothetical protein